MIFGGYDLSQMKNHESALATIIRERRAVKKEYTQKDVTEETVK